MDITLRYKQFRILVHGRNRTTCSFFCIKQSEKIWCRSPTCVSCDKSRLTDRACKVSMVNEWNNLNLLCVFTKTRFITCISTTRCYSVSVKNLLLVNYLHQKTYTKCHSRDKLTTRVFHYFYVVPDANGAFSRSALKNNYFFL